MAQRIDWPRAPIVFVTVPMCPHCNATIYETRRSTANGDGSRTKLAVCKVCHGPYKIVPEIPDFGNTAWPVDTMQVQE